MNWYSGNIAEAVTLSKKEGAVFFVAVFGDDEVSRKLEDSLGDAEVNSELSSNRYVCIRLTANSQEHLQFKQIYSGADAPCLYFISLMGAPIEVVHGEISVGDLKGKCASAWTKHATVLETQKPRAPPPAPAPENTMTGSTPAPASMPGPSTASAAEEANRSRENTPKPEGSTEDADDEAANANLTLEEKIERARILAAARQKLKMEEEAEEARRREKERREAGKGVAELKRWQEEQEAKRLVEERKREKLEEQKLRQRLREQIAQDRAERNKRTNASIVYDGAEPSTSTNPPKPSVITSAPANYSGKARLQFRMPDGSSQNHTFEKDVTLGHVRNFLSDGGHVKFSNFNLCVAFPRREFTYAEYEKTLSDLGLLPSAALLVIPAGGRGGGGPGNGGAGLWIWFTTLIGYLFYPVTFLFGVLQRALPAPGGGERSATQNPSSTSAAPGRAENRLGGSGAGAPYRGQNIDRNPGPSTSSSSEDIRKRNVKSDRSSEGNIHRLRSQESDSDDELGTWNGNSTQQKPR